MLATSTENTTAIRNYVIALASIALLSLGTADLFCSPNRSAQQSQLNDYGRYLSAGLVSYAQKGFSR